MFNFTSKTKPLPSAPVALVDYETYYDDDYSLTGMSYWAYTHDLRFDAYRVSVVTSDGIRWVGSPKDAPWDKIRGHVWVSHNRSFDETVHKRLIELQIVPDFLPVYWGDSMNLCAWLRVPRALAKAVKALYNVVVSKKVRADMKGKKWIDIPADKHAALDEYALGDGDWALKIWQEHIHKWPDHERRLSDLLNDRGLRGLPTDVEGIKSDLTVLEKVQFLAAQKIPWVEKGEPPLSTDELALACREVGIEPPPSTSMRDEGCSDWELKHGEKYPWVAAMRDWRRANTFISKYKIWKSRVKDDGWAEFQVKYLGAHTGRTASGADKGGDEKDRKNFNILNFPRDPIYVRNDFTLAWKKAELKTIADFKKKNKGALPPEYLCGVDMRSRIKAPKGFQIAICDKSQIEARITTWLSRDSAALALIRGNPELGIKGLSVYETHAVRLMNYTPSSVSLKEADPMKYALAKARELALGFQAGHIRFLEMAPTYVSDEECELIFSQPVTEQQCTDYLKWCTYTKQMMLVHQWKSLDEHDRTYRVNSWLQVQDFRAKKPLLCGPNGLWKRQKAELDRACQEGGNYEVGLPSGRTLTYFNIKKTKEGVEAQVEVNGSFLGLYEGKSVQHVVQATARDIFVLDQLHADDAGIPIILDVYDELVAVIPTTDDGKLLAEIMTINPSWAKTLPIGAELDLSPVYKK